MLKIVRALGIVGNIQDVFDLSLHLGVHRNRTRYIDTFCIYSVLSIHEFLFSSFFDHVDSLTKNIVPKRISLIKLLFDYSVVVPSRLVQCRILYTVSANKERMYYHMAWFS